MRVPLFSGIGVLFLFCTLPAPAQMAQEKEFQHGYRFFQNSAPEFLQIEVLEVTAEASKGLFGGSMTQVKARARVIDVIRSDSGTPNGQVIEIRYEHAPKAGNSAETPPIIEKEKSYPAFLKRSGTIFVPVARHLSFSPPSGIQMKIYEEARTRSREKALLAANTPPAAPINIPVVEPAPPPPTRKATPVVEPAPPAPSAAKATPVVEPAPPAPSAAKATPVVEPAPPAPSAPKATPVVEPAPPAPSAPKATPVAEPLPPAPPAPHAVAAESKPAEPTPPAPEPSQLLRDARKTRKSKAAAAAAAKANAELTPAAAESGPLPTNDPPTPAEPATAVAAAPKDKPPTPAPAKPVTASPATTAKNKTAPPPPAPAPQVSRTPAPKPKEEPLPNIPLEPPVVPPVETVQKPAPQPSTEGAEARKGYAEIYGMIKEGETVQNEGKNDKAREIYTQAREKLLILKSEQPEFQPFMVQYRIRDLEKKLETLSKPAPEKPPGTPAK